MSTNARLAAAELALYALALWASYEMAKTPDQRLHDRLRAYWWATRVCGWAAECFGRAAIRAELAYWKEAKP